MAEEALFRRNKKADEEEKARWKTIRELWDRASNAEIELERAGKPVTIEAIWTLVRLNEDQIMPRMVRTALEHPGYKQLVELRKRMLVLPALKDLGALREVTGQASFIALNSALEDLLIHPERISTAEKRQLAKTFMDMNLRLSGIKVDDDKENETGTDTLAEIANRQASALHICLGRFKCWFFAVHIRPYKSCHTRPFFALL